VERIELVMDTISNENLLELSDIPELLIALPTTIVSVPPTTSILRHLVSMLPESDRLSLMVISAVVEVLNRWKRTYAKDLEVCLIESLEELTSAMEAEPNDAVAQVGVHFVTIFVHWWKLQLDPEDGFWSKALMSKLIALGGLAQYEFPIEWHELAKKPKKRQTVAVFSDSD